jgi:hypothetical protein
MSVAPAAMTAAAAAHAQSRTVEYQAGDIGRLGQTALHNLRGKR